MSKQSGAEPHGWLNTETLKTRVGEFEFKNGYPTDDTGRRVKRAACRYDRQHLSPYSASSRSDAMHEGPG